MNKEENGKNRTSKILLSFKFAYKQEQRKFYNLV